MRWKLSVILASLSLAGCTVLYSTPQTWGRQGGGLHQFNAEYRVGVTGRKIIIFCNGTPIMRGKAHYWSRRITMTGKVDGQPAAAVCGGTEAKGACVISVAGEEVATLRF